MRGDWGQPCVRRKVRVVRVGISLGKEKWCGTITRNTAEEGIKKKKNEREHTTKEAGQKEKENSRGFSPLLKDGEWVYRGLWRKEI